MRVHSPRARCRDCAERARREDEPFTPAEIPMLARMHLSGACQMMAHGKPLYAHELALCGLALLANAPQTHACRDLREQLLTLLQEITRERPPRGM
jgi:hypothetical protein